MPFNIPMQDQTVLMQLADNMAAAATTFNSHGYDSFISAREEFKKSVAELDLDRRNSNRGEKLMVDPKAAKNYNFNLKFEC